MAEEVKLNIKVTSDGTEKITDTAKDLDELNEKGTANNTSFSNLSKGFLNAGTQAGNLGKSTISLASKLGVMGIAGAIGAKTLNKLYNFTKESIKEAENYNTAISNLTSAVNTYGSTTYSLEEVEEDATEISDNYKVSRSNVADMLDKGVEKTKDLDTAERILIDAIELEKAGVDDVKTNYEKLLGAWDGSLEVINDANETMPIGMQAVNEEVRKLMAGKDETLGYINDVNDKWDKLGDDIKTSWGQDWLLQIAQWKDEILEILDNIKTIKEQYVDPMVDKLNELFDSAPNWIKGIVDGLAGVEDTENTDTAYSVTQNIADSVVDEIASNLPGGGALTSFRNALTAIENKDSSLKSIASILFPDVYNLVDKVKSIAGISNLANGGTIAESGIVNVGENGPEQIYLPTGANVIPNSSSNGINITLNVSGSVWTTRQLADELGSLFHEQMVLRGAF